MAYLEHYSDMTSPLIVREWRKSDPTIQSLPLYTSLGRSDNLETWLVEVFEHSTFDDSHVPDELKVS